MSYISILNDDILIVIISKLNSGLSIRNFSTIYEIYLILSRLTTWKVLLKLKNEVYFNKLKEARNLNVGQCKICYYLTLADPTGKSFDDYIKIKDVDIDAPGSRNMVKITWDNIIDRLIINRNCINLQEHLMTKHSLLSKQEARIDVVINYALYLNNHYTNLFQLVMTYQNNFDVYNKILSQLNLLNLEVLISSIQYDLDSYLSYMKPHTIEENIEDIKLILKDLQHKS